MLWIFMFLLGHIWPLLSNFNLFIDFLILYQHFYITDYSTLQMCDNKHKAVWQLNMTLHEPAALPNLIINFFIQADIKMSSLT